MSEPILHLQRRLDQFRSTQPRRTKLPEPLWQAAVELARQHGIYPVAPPLRLDYMRLKKRLGGVSSRRRKPTKPPFMELIIPRSAAPGIVPSSSRPLAEARCASRWKAAKPPDWASLLRAWRESGLTYSRERIPLC